MDQRKRKIAILGGGVSGLAAAYELTSYPGWDQLYDVTVYEVGWRLGGKTATGRGPCDRIEEHGLHVLMGWYWNTFRMLRDVFAERHEERLEPGSPFHSIEEAFIPDNTLLMPEFDAQAGRWLNWPIRFPTNGARPGGPPLSLWETIQQAVRLLLEMLLSAGRNVTPGDPRGKLGARLRRALRGALAAAKVRTAAPGSSELLDGALPAGGGGAGDGVRELVSGIMKLLRPAGETSLLAGHRRMLDFLASLIDYAGSLGVASRRWLMMASTAYYNLKGALRDVWDPALSRFDFSRINDRDYREWLTELGAPDEVVHSTLMRYIYVSSFANLANDKGGLLAAGTALQAIALALGYQGSFVYLFSAGAGDTMIAPLYQVLQHRGVEFRFFHAVTDVCASDSDEIEELRLAEQVTLAPGVTRYDPLITVTTERAGTPGHMRAWPRHPLYEQLDPRQAQELQDRQIDLESPWSGWTPAREVSLRKGRDFDEIILAIPIAALKSICREIIQRKPSWRAMVENVGTTATQAMQLWLRPSLRELGMHPEQWGLTGEGACASAVNYANAMSSWMDSSHVLWAESWPDAQRPRLLLYFTGALRASESPSDAPREFVDRQTDQIRLLARQWLMDNAGFFWPRCATPEYPQGMDLGLLAAPLRADGAPVEDGEEKFKQQWFSAGVLPAKRYTLSLPATARYRLRTDQSGYRNLFLAGDWIDYGLNAGCVEGSVISGLLAAQALRKSRYGITAHRELLRYPDVHW